jgi:hypothetical protein
MRVSPSTSIVAIRGDPVGKPEPFRGVDLPRVGEDLRLAGHDDAAGGAVVALIRLERNVGVLHQIGELRTVHRAEDDRSPLNSVVHRKDQRLVLDADGQPAEHSSTQELPAVPLGKPLGRSLWSPGGLIIRRHAVLPSNWLPLHPGTVAGYRGLSPTALRRRQILRQAGRGPSPSRGLRGRTLDPVRRWGDTRS